MTLDGAEVERIVAEVLRRLTRQSDSPRAASDANGHAKQETRTSTVGELVIPDRVVAVASIANRLHGVRQLVVRPDAVVTPAVLDELRRRNIQLQRDRSDSGNSPASQTTTSGQVQLVAVREKIPAGVAMRLAGTVGAEVHWAGCTPGAVRQTRDLLNCTDRCIVLLSPEPALALCLVSRDARARALMSCCQNDVTAQADAIGANVLVVNPIALGSYQLNNLVARFVAGAPRPCPAALAVER